MYDSRQKRLIVNARCGTVEVQHNPQGAIGHTPAEHYRVISGPGASDLAPEALDELIADLQTLRRLTYTCLTCHGNGGPNPLEPCPGCGAYGDSRS